MIESKSIKVAAEQEQKAINTLACFGWTLQSSQEINVKDSHIETIGDDVYSVTESEHYVKLVFQRNTEMANYAEIAKIEKQYNDMSAPVSYKSKLLTKVGIGVGVIGLLMLLGGLTAVGVIVIILGIAAIVWEFIKNNKKEEVYDEEMKVYNAKRDELKNQAGSLVK